MSKEINDQDVNRYLGKTKELQESKEDPDEKRFFEHLMGAEPGSVRYQVLEIQIEFLEAGSNIKKSNRIFDKFQQNRREIEGYSEEDKMLDELLVSSGYYRKYTRGLPYSERMPSFTRKLKEIRDRVLEAKSRGSNSQLF